ncbi:MAG: hypothetical protein ACI4LK_00010 [Lentihominibacter sp.]
MSNRIKSFEQLRIYLCEKELENEQAAKVSKPAKNTNEKKNKKSNTKSTKTKKDSASGNNKKNKGKSSESKKKPKKKKKTVKRNSGRLDGLPVQSFEAAAKERRRRIEAASAESLRKRLEREKAEREALESGEFESNRIYFDDFVALHDTRRCRDKGHEVENIKAGIVVLQANGKRKRSVIPAAYCWTCGRYIISTHVYENLRQYGVPLCQEIHDGDNHSGKSGSYYDTLKAESKLYSAGYNVSSEDELSDKQRQGILELLLESGICSRGEIIDHLTWLIETRRGNPSMVNAVSKWTSDRNYIERYKLGSARMVGIRLVRNLKPQHKYWFED